MGNRLSKIATRTGDNGTTGLGDGSRTEKDSARIASLGDVDELNSFVGLLLCEDMPADLREELITIQHDLFDLGADLSVPGRSTMTDAHVERLEKQLDQLNSALQPLKEFILPGGGPAAAACHLARTIARRAERRVLTLARAEAVSPEVLKYLNRLSDLLFVIARVLARHERGTEVLWRHERRGA